MIASRRITQLFSTIMIAFLIVTTGYVLVPAPAHHAAPNVTAQDVSSVALTSAALLPTVTTGGTNLASVPPTLPNRSAGCSLCNPNPGVVALIVQLDAAPLSGGPQYATNVFSQLRSNLARTIAQRQPDPLERPPTA